MPGRSFRVGRIAGIPIGISPWWLAIVALITWTLGAGYYPDEVHGIAPVTAYGLGLLSALLLFASILAHELGHALVARRRGVEIEEIDLWLLGGVARMSGHPRCGADELAFALAGPAVTAIVAIVFGALALVLPDSAPGALTALITYQAEVNLLILGFNLLPAFPLDGGRVARAILWRRSGDLARSTATAAGLGRGFGYVLIAGGVMLWVAGDPGGLWIAIIGFFLTAAASAERAQEQTRSALLGLRVRDVMSRHPIAMPVDLSTRVATAYFSEFRHASFPVTDAAGRPVGLLSLDALEHVTDKQRELGRVAELADTDPGLVAAEDDDVVSLLERPAFRRVGRVAVVGPDERLVGIVSITDLERAMRARQLTAQAALPPGRVPHR